MNELTEEQPKQKMTDEERLALAAKLDADLDEWMDSLEKRRYSEGWPEDRWQEEMDKHPFFMKKAPEPGQTLSPLMEGLQQLKFDTAENDALTLGQNYKDDGNFYVKHKKFRLAVLSYSEALKQKFEENELRATLYNNRSASQFFLKNYRSSFNDANKALSLKPDYAKARARAAQCAIELKEFDMCVDLCDQILQDDPLNVVARDLRVEAVERKTIQARDARKNETNLRKKKEQLERTLTELQKRAVKFEDNYGTGRTVITEQMLKPSLLPLEDFRVTADVTNVLYWPAVFCYPEFTFSDFQQQLCEDTTLADCLETMLEEPLECDRERKYCKLDKLNVYYENRLTARVHKLDVTKKIRDIVAEKFYFIINGTIYFYILPKESSAEKEFLNVKRHPLKRNLY